MFNMKGVYFLLYYITFFHHPQDPIVKIRFEVIFLEYFDHLTRQNYSIYWEILKKNKVAAEIGNYLLIEGFCRLIRLILYVS